MVTLNRVGGTNLDRNAEFYGKSRDTKPTKANGEGLKLRNGDLFVEMDTASVYFYDESTDTWLEA